ncbi:MAG: helix-turn-helix transcriptional regulator [candidate division WOR-3 bacterium]
MTKKLHDTKKPYGKKLPKNIIKILRLYIIKEYALLKGINSLRELAKKLNVSYYHLHKVIKGERKSKKLIEKIENLLNVNLEKEINKLLKRR